MVTLAQFLSIYLGYNPQVRATLGKKGLQFVRLV